MNCDYDPGCGVYIYNIEYEELNLELWEKARKTDKALIKISSALRILGRNK